MLESLFNKVAGLHLYYKETPTQVFSCEYCEMFKSSFLYNTSIAASEQNRKKNYIHILTSIIRLICSPSFLANPLVRILIASYFRISKR